MALKMFAGNVVGSGGTARQISSDAVRLCAGWFARHDVRGDGERGGVVAARRRAPANYANNPAKAGAEASAARPCGTFEREAGPLAVTAEMDVAWARIQESLPQVRRGGGPALLDAKRGPMSGTAQRGDDGAPAERGIVGVGPGSGNSSPSG